MNVFLFVVYTLQKKEVLGVCSSVCVSSQSPNPSILCPAQSVVPAFFLSPCISRSRPCGSSRAFSERKHFEKENILRNKTFCKRTFAKEPLRMTHLHMTPLHKTLAWRSFEKVTLTKQTLTLTDNYSVTQHCVTEPHCEYWTLKKKDTLCDRITLCVIERCNLHIFGVISDNA